MKLYTKNKEKLYSIGFFNVVIYKFTPSAIGPGIYIIASFFPYLVEQSSFSLKENKQISSDLDTAIKIAVLKQ